MSRDFIAQLYADTPCWLWPVLWIEIYWMQVRLARLPDADDPQDLYEVRLNEWGQLQLIKLYTHIDTPDDDAWMSGSRLDSDLFSTDAYLTPHLRRMPEPQASTLMGQAQAHTSTRSQPKPGARNLGSESFYLDPG
jgi:hypothetical protein